MSLLATLFGFKNSKNKNIIPLNAKDFKIAVTSKKVQLIDVRTLKEYNSGCIKTAKNIDIFSSDFATEANKLDKEKPIYLYCRSGARSKRASKKLATLGFIEIYDLKGGILNYN